MGLVTWDAHLPSPWRGISAHAAPQKQNVVESVSGKRNWNKLTLFLNCEDLRLMKQPLLMHRLFLCLLKLR